ncbi:MAG TPA: hypothetical protein VLW75_01200 [Rhizomicrobium sp.]|nr:hypothetical protein [Rhizomicrobium sp.]
MSELIDTNDNRAAIRWKLLTGASALVLAAATPAFADEPSDHPLIWIELGGDADAISGLNEPFAPDFMLFSPTPTPFKDGNSPVGLQKPPRYTFGGDGTLTFQPEGSDWKFSAGIKYGRSNNKRDRHSQTNATIKFPNPAYEHIAALYPSYLPYFTSLLPTYTKYAPKFAETTVTQSERHMVLDFEAGKDVGLGMFGRGTSTLSAGVRVARFQFKTDVLVHARPNADFYSSTFPNPWGAGPHASYVIYQPHWASYYLRASAERTFKGIGPSLTWKATVPLAGNVEKGELELDWGINGAVLFGKQKAKIRHHTSARYYKPKYSYSHTTPGGLYHQNDHYEPLYNRNYSGSRSHSVTVPNIGATIGLSYRIQNTKLSVGYRADYFLNAMDVGIDAARKKTLSFNGLFASVSVGLGD